MRDYAEVLHWNDGAVEEYEANFVNDKEARQFAEKEFEKHKEVKRYEVFCNGKMVFQLER